jgi:hypothetical protein
MATGSFETAISIKEQGAMSLNNAILPSNSFINQSRILLPSAGYLNRIFIFSYGFRAYLFKNQSWFNTEKRQSLSWQRNCYYGKGRGGVEMVVARQCCFKQNIKPENVLETMQLDVILLEYRKLDSLHPYTIKYYAKKACVGVEA